MQPKRINLLAIEDSVFDARLLREILLDIPYFDFDLYHDRTLTDGLATLTHSDPDVVLLDLMLPDCGGLETVDRVHAAAPFIPIIVLTHMDDEASAVEAVRRGAQDYLLKGRYDARWLSSAIAYAIERKCVERAVHQNHEMRTTLEREVLEVSTREQQRISQDLHDSVGQQLTGLGYLASSLSKQLDSLGLPEAAQARTLVDGIRESQAEVQRAIRGLAPVEVDAEGLMAALAQLAEQTEARFPVTCRFACDDAVLVDDVTTATHLYRIAQEALHNAVKHADADCIEVKLQLANGNICLEVTDNGTGLEESSGGASGMGLHIMNYRARAIDAELEVTSSDGRGTMVTCVLDSEEHDVCHDA